MGDTFVNQVQRLGTDTGGLVPGRAALLFDAASFEVTDAPETLATAPDGSTITGVTIVTAKVAQAKERIQLVAGLILDTATAYGTIGAEYFDTATSCPSATIATLSVVAARASGSGTFSVQLWDGSNEVGVLTFTEASPTRKAANVSAGVIRNARMLYLRAMNDSGTTGALFAVRVDLS